MARNVSDATKELYKELGHATGTPLTKEQALKMLQDNFQLTEKQAQDIFAFFDKRNKNEFSMFQYEQFVKLMGKRANALMCLFDKLEDKNNPGFLDLTAAKEQFKTMKTRDGKPVVEKELEDEIANYRGREEPKDMDIEMFINFMCGRLGFCKGLAEI